MKIKSITARPELDSRGEWTIEVRLKLQNGLESVASVPQGKSRGSSEAVYVKPNIAIRNIEKIIAPALKGLHAGNQNFIDHCLLKLDGTKNKSKLGANATLGVSVAAAKAAALSQNIPLWKHIAHLLEYKRKRDDFPKLFVNVINGGLHTKNNLDFQEYLIIPKSKNISESVKIALTLYKKLGEYLGQHFGKDATGLGDEGGFAPNLDDNLEPFRILTHVAKLSHLENKIQFGLDAAASNIKKSPAALSKLYAELKIKYKLHYLEDPYKEKDFKNFTKLNQAIGKNTLLCGDDLTTTNVELMKKAHAAKSINSIIIKPNQIGTLTETLAAIEQAKKWGWKVAVSHRSGETQDDFIADLAYGSYAYGLKLGAPARGERVAKYNRLLEIDQEN
ncbi:MAG: phosphopyruvate hydratase [Candidatus Liptonbacteria bacterium]|nr:phosphopyruvate hydratase [Candidatus Liptonbacteria bacterium]